MSAELARDPSSVVFLKLGELLRDRGQHESAAKVVMVGLDLHPGLADAHDLYARILVDMGQYQRAYDEWMAAVEFDPRHCGARKGLGFLCYRWRDIDGALEHLELALASDPNDPAVVRALKTVRRGAATTARSEAAAGTKSAFEGLSDADHGVLLGDARGRVLAGVLLDGASEDVAAHVAAGGREADRTARILELGAWEWMIVESEGGNLHVSRPVTDAILVVARDRDVPVGRLALIANSATSRAREWLEAQRQ